MTGDEGYAAALAGREALPAEVRARYRPYPFLRDDMLAALAAADLVVGRAGSSTLAEVDRARRCRWSSSRIRTPPATSAPTRASLVDAGAARLVEDEAFDADALVDAAAHPRRPGRATLAMSAAARALGRPGAADAVAELVLAAGRAPAAAGPRRRSTRRRARDRAA